MGRYITAALTPKEAGPLDTAMRSVRSLSSRVSGTPTLAAGRSMSALTGRGTRAAAAGSTLPMRAVGSSPGSALLRSKFGKPGMAGNPAAQGSATLPGPSLKSGPSLSATSMPPAGIQPGINAPATPAGGSIPTKTSSASAHWVDESRAARYGGHNEGDSMPSQSTLMDRVLARAEGSASHAVLTGGAPIMDLEKMASDVLAELHLVATTYGLETPFDKQHARQINGHLQKVAADVLGTLPVTGVPEGRQTMPSLRGGPSVHGPYTGSMIPTTGVHTGPHNPELPRQTNSLAHAVPGAAPATLAVTQPAPNVHRDVNGERVAQMHTLEGVKRVTHLDMQRERVRQSAHHFRTGDQAEKQIDLPPYFAHQGEMKNALAEDKDQAGAERLAALRAKLRKHEEKETPADEKKESPAHQRMERALGTEMHNPDGSKKAGAPHRPPTLVLSALNRRTR